MGPCRPRPAAAGAAPGAAAAAAPWSAAYPAWHAPRGLDRLASAREPEKVTTTEERRASESSMALDQVRELAKEEMLQDVDVLFQ